MNKDIIMMTRKTSIIIIAMVLVILTVLPGCNCQQINEECNGTLFDIFNGDEPRPGVHIFLLDTAQYILSKEHHEAVDFMRKLIEKRLLLRADVNRIAVVTTSPHPTAVIDYISAGRETVPECELFMPGGLWDRRVKYVTRLPAHEPFQEALDLVENISKEVNLSLSGMEGNIWFMTDFANNTVKHTVEYVVNKKTFPGYRIYGVGLDANSPEDLTWGCNFEISSGDNSVNCSCPYHHISQERDHKAWCHIINSSSTIRHKADRANSGYVSITNKTMFGGKCSCREFLSTYTSLSCQPCQQVSWLPVIIGVIVSTTITALAALLYCVCRGWCIRHKQVPKTDGFVASEQQLRDDTHDPNEDNLTDLTEENETTPALPEHSPCKKNKKVPVYQNEQITGRKNAGKTKDDNEEDDDEDADDYVWPDLNHAYQNEQANTPDNLELSKDEADNGDDTYYNYVSSCNDSLVKDKKPKFQTQESDLYDTFDPNNATTPYANNNNKNTKSARAMTEESNQNNKDIGKNKAEKGGAKVSKKPSIMAIDRPHVRDMINKYSK